MQNEEINAEPEDDRCVDIPEKGYVGKLCWSIYLDIKNAYGKKDKEKKMIKNYFSIVQIDAH